MWTGGPERWKVIMAVGSLDLLERQQAQGFLQRCYKRIDCLSWWTANIQMHKFSRDCLNRRLAFVLSFWSSWASSGITVKKRTFCLWLRLLFKTARRKKANRCFLRGNLRILRRSMNLFKTQVLKNENSRFKTWITRYRQKITTHCSFDRWRNWQLQKQKNVITWKKSLVQLQKRHTREVLLRWFSFLKGERILKKYRIHLQEVYLFRVIKIVFKRLADYGTCKHRLQSMFRRANVQYGYVLASKSLRILFTILKMEIRRRKILATCE